MNDATEQWENLYDFMKTLQSALLSAIAKPQHEAHRVFASKMITANQQWIEAFEQTVDTCSKLPGGE